MKQFFTLSILLSTVLSSAFGQDKQLSIKGSVFENATLPVDYANITLNKIADSTVIAGVASNEKGLFELSAPAGDYFVKVTFFGMEERHIPLKSSEGNVDLGKIILEAKDAKEVRGAVVIGDRIPMSLQIDKRVYNVGADINNQGSNASDVLANIPSVTVDAEGNVSLRGSQAVRILVDGKLSGFASSADALQQLQADQIDKIEIITNASARYEAQGEAGIINIILKKNRTQGFNGSLTAKAGISPDNGFGFNGNYRKNKLNLYGSLNLNQRGVLGKSTTYQRLETPDTGFIYFQNYQHNRKKLGYQASVGMDYELDAKNSISASISLREGKGDHRIDRSYDNYTLANDFLSRDTRVEFNTELEGLVEANLGFTRKLDEKGSEWKTTLKAYQDKDFEDSKFDENSSLDTAIDYARSNAYITERLALVQSDLKLKFSSTAKLETGLRAQVRDFNNEFGYSTLENTGWESPSMFNDRFNYNEKVYAAYLMGANQFGKLGVQAGLRGEYSQIFTRQYSLGDGNTRSYVNLFPSAAMSYKQNDNTTFQLSYSRRINRPGQWNLMPFMKFGDNREMRIGNPNLDPELTDSYEASTLFTWETGSLLSALYYRHTKNKFENIAFLGDNGIIYRQAMNVSAKDAYGAEFNANYSPFKWGRITSGFNFYKEQINGNFNGQQFDVDNFTWSNKTSVNITLPQRWRFQLSGNYEAPRVSAQGRSLAMRFMDFGMSKDVLKNKATLGFNVGDIFNSRQWRGETNTPEIQSQTMFQWRQRSFRLTFTYRFNQQVKDNGNENLTDNNSGGGEQ